MEAILDTNFIVSCVKKKIDFINELEGQGFKVLLPKEVFEEIKDLKLNSDRATKVACDVALEIFRKRKVKNVTLGDRQVDEGLIEFGKKGAYIATLDGQIRRQIPNKIGISEAGNNILVERS
jgi:rRNA-processing protein FCF1